MNEIKINRVKPPERLEEWLIKLTRRIDALERRVQELENERTKILRAG